MEAQTLANVYFALENDLEILPVINKIDLPSAEPERVKQEIEESSAWMLGAVLGFGQGGDGIKEISGTDREEGSPARRGLRMHR